MTILQRKDLENVFKVASFHLFTDFPKPIYAGGARMRLKQWFGICLSLLLLFAFSTTVSAQQKVIKIGAVYPLSGNIASTGLDCKRGVDLAVDIINGKYGKDLNLPMAKSGGLPNLGGAKLEIVYADTKGDPKNGMSEAERLVTQEKVSAIIGAYQSSVTKTASQATERLKVPYVCSDSGFCRRTV